MAIQFDPVHDFQQQINTVPDTDRSRRKTTTSTKKGNRWSEKNGRRRVATVGLVGGKLSSQRVRGRRPDPPSGWILWQANMWLVRLTQRQVGGLAAEQGMLRFFVRAKGQLTLVGTERGDVREAEIIRPRIRSCTAREATRRIERFTAVVVMYRDVLAQWEW